MPCASHPSFIDPNDPTHPPHSHVVIPSFLQPLAAHYRDLSPKGDVKEAAATLFEGLRWAEAVGGEGLLVLVVDLREEEQGE